MNRFAAPIVCLLATPVAGQPQSGARASLDHSVHAPSRNYSISSSTGAAVFHSVSTPAGGYLAPECKNILAFGGDRTGASDNSAAFEADVAAQDPLSICVYFPTGTYRFSRQPTITFRSMALGSATLIGDGREVSNIAMDSGISGPKFVMGSGRQSIHVRSLSVLAGGTSVTTAGISATLASAASRTAQSDITAVSVRGSDGYDNGSTHFFGTAVALTGVSSYDFIDDVFSGAPYSAGGFTNVGTCLSIQGTSSLIPIVFNLIGTQVNYCGVGLLYGKYVQGVSITASNFTGNGVGISIPSGQTGNDQLAVTSSQFNNGSADIRTGSAIDGVTINGNDFYSITRGGVAIAFDAVDSYAITGNTFIGTGSAENAITVGGGVSGTIVGNQFKGSGFGTCVRLDAGSRNANVQSNSYVGGCTPVSDAGKNNTIGGGSR